MEGPVALIERFRRVAIATHYLFPGAAMELEAYLRPRTERLVFVGHPLFPDAGDTYWREYRAGELLAEHRRRPLPGPGRYAGELWWTRAWTQGAAPLDLYVGGDSLLTLPGLWLRARGRARTVVVYTMDYVPRRFSSATLNWVYHRVDRAAATHADLAWNVSPQIDAARRDRDGSRRLAPHLVVPIGVHVERIQPRPLADANPHELAFVSHLIEKQGLQLAIEALPAIRRSVPQASILVIGDGPHRGALERLAGAHGVSDWVRFEGQIDDHERLEQRLTRAALALAPYVPDPSTWTRYADPSKIKLYLACGLPIVMTDEFASARQIEAAGAGVVIPYEPAALAQAVVAYLSHRRRLEAARRAAVTFAQDLGWERIFDRALAATAEQPSLR